MERRSVLDDILLITGNVRVTDDVGTDVGDS